MVWACLMAGGVIGGLGMGMMGMAGGGRCSLAGMGLLGGDPGWRARGIVGVWARGIV